MSLIAVMVVKRPDVRQTLIKKQGRLHVKAVDFNKLFFFLRQGLATQSSVA